MSGLLTVAGRRGLSAGTLLIAAGGLTLYQLTSLVLGPGGSRELPLSLAIPAVDAHEISEAVRPRVNEVLSLTVSLTPSSAAMASRPGLRRHAQTQAMASPTAAPVITTPPALPLPSEAAAKHGQGYSQPARHRAGD